MLDDPVKKWIVGAAAIIIIVAIAIWGSINVKKAVGPEIDRSKPPADFLRGYSKPASPTAPQNK
jgi:hypothetical protein